MYQVIKEDGNVIAICDKIRYIKLNPLSGALIEAKDENDAEGVAVNGTPYSLINKNKFQNFDKVIINEIDSGIFIFEDMNKIKEHSDSIATIEDYLCEQDKGGL